MTEVTPPPRWVNARLGRLPAGQEGQCACDRSLMAHQGIYRAQVVDSTTGEVVEASLCLHKASAWALKHRVAFPPGMWARGEDAPHKPPQVFEIPAGSQMATCSSCRENIKWIVTKNNRRMPVDLDGTSHFVTCVNRDQHRKPRSKAAYVASQGQTRDHHCHWPGCAAQVPPAQWGCKTHWFRLPKEMRDRIWAAYQPGQEKTMTPSPEYLDVADDVQRWIQENGK